MLQQIIRPVRNRPLPESWSEISGLARIVAVVQNDPEAWVGSSCYFIRDPTGKQGQLYRLIPGSTRASPQIEQVYARAYGIEADDLDTGIDGLREYEEYSGLFQIPDLIHRKLTALGDGC